MKKLILFLVSIPILASLFNSCIEPYDPELPVTLVNGLVVEGYVDVIAMNASFKLSRTLPLVSEETETLEIGAKVSIETKTGQKFELAEIKDGEYFNDQIEIDLDDSCKLIIVTFDQTVYHSSFEPVKLTPPIDSVNWTIDSDGLYIFVNTHDPLNKTNFYRWEYEETSHYQSPYFSGFIYDHSVKNVVPRDLRTQDIYNCWITFPSPVIHLQNNSLLNVDRVGLKKLISIEANSWKSQIKFSLLVRQYALTEGGYNYWKKIKENTETIGTLFDPQPVNLKGNIKAVDNPDLPVVGYFSVGSLSQERIFITRGELPGRWYYIQDPPCNQSSELIPLDQIHDTPGAFLYINPEVSGGRAIGYYTNLRRCIDCRQVHRGGKTTRPDFWE